LNVARVHYPHHPHAGCEVGVLARRRSSRTLYVLLPDQTTATLPEWMFDAAYCHVLPFQETPVLSLDALHDLRRLLDAASLPCDANNSTKQTHEEKNKSPDRTAMGQREGEQPLAGESGRGMSSTDRPVAAQSAAGGEGGAR
jgi:hypothetical protein